MEMHTLRGKSLVSRLMAILGVSLVTVAMMACAGQPATSDAVDSGSTPTATSPAGEAAGSGNAPTATSPASEAAGSGNVPTATSPASEAAGSGDTPAATSPTAPEVLLEDISSASFSDPINVDNEWFSLPPGKQLILEGNTIEDGESIPHRIEFTVTGLTKEIEGIETVVVWIADYGDEELVEKEIAFYAQADDGTVWFLGEHPEEYEEGELVDAPTWIAGIQGARAGIIMPADPQVGTPRFSQGWGPAVDWTDQARVAEMGLEVTLPLGAYQDVLVMEETSMEELALGVFQFKYYAPDVGVIKVGFTGEDQTQETLEMTEFNQLDPDELEETNALALDLEQHAYEISKDVYGLTAPSRAIASS